MVLRQMAWSPDTCDCRIIYEYDDSLDIDSRTLTPVQTENICSVHTDEPSLQELGDSVRIEHIRKNQVYRNLLDNALPDMIDTDANGVITFKNNIKITWGWSGVRPNRILTITLTGKTLTTNQKNAVQTRLDNAFPNQNIVFVN